jgi:hypothetical protein
LVGQRLEAKNEEGLDEGALAAYAAVVQRLLVCREDGDSADLPPVHKVRLGDEASEARRIFHNRVERMMGSGEILDDCRDIAAKAVTQTVKLAQYLHLAAVPELIAESSSEISGTTWADAEELGQWFLDEAVRVQRMADEDPILEAARRILGWLQSQRQELVASRHLQREGPRPRPKAREAAAVLELLADHGYLRNESSVGTRSPVYRVHPTLLSPQSPQSPSSPGSAAGIESTDSRTNPATMATLAIPYSLEGFADLPHTEVV